MSFQIDWKTALDGVNNDRGLLKLVIDAFLKESVQIQDQISTAIANQESKLLQRNGHTLRGILQSLGATDWSEPARQLEAIGAAGTTAGAQKKADELNRQLPTLLEQLRTFSVEQNEST